MDGFAIGCMPAGQIERFNLLIHAASKTGSSAEYLYQGHYRDRVYIYQQRGLAALIG